MIDCSQTPRRFAIAIAFACLALVGTLLSPVAKLQAAELPPLAHQMARHAPRIAPELRLNDLDGVSHTLADLRGRVVLINFWATWCPPCRREMPSMARLVSQLAGEPFSVLAVDVGETPEAIGLFTSQLDASPNFPILLDTRSRAMKAWKVAGLPTTYLVDKNGRIVATAIGGREFDHPEMVATIRALLSAPAACTAPH